MRQIYSKQTPGQNIHQSEHILMLKSEYFTDHRWLTIRFIYCTCSADHIVWLTDAVPLIPVGLNLGCTFLLVGHQFSPLTVQAFLWYLCNNICSHSPYSHFYNITYDQSIYHLQISKLYVHQHIYKHFNSNIYFPLLEDKNAR